MPITRPPTAKGFTKLLNFFVAVFLISTVHAQHLTAKQVLVIFNKTDPDSEKLAEAYQDSRGLPDSRLLGLDLSQEQDISRDEYEKSIAKPIRAYMDQKGWWKRGKDAEGHLLPISNEIRVILLMRGVPLRIKPDPISPPEKDAPPPADPISSRTEAAVDSELAMLGIETLPTNGALKNAFFDSKTPLSQANIPYMFLTSRIDAPTYAVCKRMIDDAVATEVTGLWGRAYVDVANKFPQGDEWLNNIIKQNNALGIPTVTDRFNDTLPKNFPMTEASIYYGWYDWNVSGPFLNTGFLFRPGAVAIHLHSYSAQQLRNAHQNWCAPLLVRGAAATVGNVYEPFLHLTHHFDILQDRLLKGWTFAEASWAAMPVASWQGIVLGDPLYRPFMHIDGTGKNLEKDRDFRALRAAFRQWPDDAKTRNEKLSAAAEKLKSGNLAEGLALEYKEAKDLPNAVIWFNKAKEFFQNRPDKLRQDLQLIAITREAGKKQEAIVSLREARKNYSRLPEAESLAGWLDILDPPPPPIADPTKQPKQ